MFLVDRSVTVLSSDGTMFKCPPPIAGFYRQTPASHNDALRHLCHRSISELTSKTGKEQDRSPFRFDGKFETYNRRSRSGEKGDKEMSVI